MRFIFALTIAMLFAQSAYAQTKATSARIPNGYAYIICNAETVDGICDGAGATAGDDTYVDVSQFDRFTVFLEEAGGPTVTCEVYATDEILQAPAADMSSFTTNRINSVSMSDSQDSITFGGDFGYMWVSCAGVATSVTVTLRGQVGRSRNDR